MSYKALYREWRPGSFEELVGQDHIATTLKNSIINDRIAHAYLFCGPRGTGKTSTAKVFAKGLNCSEGPTQNPCDICEYCKSMNEGRFFDVIEIDAASNRGIDEIREIRDQVLYPPSEGRYKVYIIDEVHMLTQEAFNALLKTLEEPPRHIIFILATTEPHRLPTTILSRCQRFDFHRLSIKNIVGRLEEVLINNNVQYEDKALYTIARNAEGGMRDALSLLDQCLSFSENKELKNEHVLGIIGSVDEDVFYNLVQSIVDSDIISTLSAVKEIIDKGKDVNQFLKDLMTYFRDILLVNTGSEDEELIKGEYQNLKELAGCFKNYELIAMIDYISEKQKELRWSQNSRLILEMTLFRLINRDKMFSEQNDKINYLEDKINNLESRLKDQKLDDFEGELKVRQKENNQKQQKKQEEKIEQEEQQYEKEAEGNLPDSQKETAGEIGGEEVTISEINSQWSDILSSIKKEKIYAHAYVVEGKPYEVKNSVLYIGFSSQHNIHMERAAKKENKEAIEKVLNTYFPGIKVSFKMISDDEKKSK
ncbi:DNA polymerase III subunit gamma/tau [Natranaerofaba carboxydovora]|uniref:DNA polymerase III subunit gamma/tau n=1 Tax=Natranaerofaba carboxydovora TaxID=2742683 RepID=UPI001F13C6B0|nr:DNA polymerase III subunit gamma/tau [Natranaerofaba carboxydovora]UMZ75217.1 DNA polymerase III subunit tau [Natranaerofaba carboxydovora]